MRLSIFTVDSPFWWVHQWGGFFKHLQTWVPVSPLAFLKTKFGWFWCTPNHPKTSKLVAHVLLRQVAQQRDQGALTRHMVQLQQLQDQDHVCKGFETALVEQILGTGRKTTTMTRSVKLLALNFRNKNMLQYCGFNIYVICSLCSFSSAVELYLIIATMALWSSQWHTSPRVLGSPIAIGFPQLGIFDTQKIFDDLRTSELTPAPVCHPFLGWWNVHVVPPVQRLHRRSSWRD